jgi:hypothetical protein
MAMDCKPMRKGNNVKFEHLSEGVRTLAVLTTETNKSIVRLATLQHVTGHVYAVCLNHSEASRPAVIAIEPVEVRLVCSNSLTV